MGTLSHIVLSMVHILAASRTLYVLQLPRVCSKAAGEVSCSTESSRQGLAKLFAIHLTEPQNLLCAFALLHSCLSELQQTLPIVRSFGQ